jgi:tetratricopeptide (TPR) repeat protein
MEHLRGKNHASLLPVLAQLAESRRSSGDHSGQQETLAKLLEVCQACGDTNQAIKVVQSMALAHDAVGRKAEAEQAYRQALAWAREYGDHDRLSNVLRNFALFLKEQRQEREAEAMLRDAVAEARAAYAPEPQGRGLAALGILVQHGGRLDEARAILEEAIQVLPASHADLLYVRSHLNAIESGGSCGCGDMGYSIGETLRAIVLPSLPDDLLEDLRFDPDKGIQVHLSRKPTPEEQELLQRVMGHAMRELRSSYDRSGYS